MTTSMVFSFALLASMGLLGDAVSVRDSGDSAAEAQTGALLRRQTDTTSQEHSSKQSAAVASADSLLAATEADQKLLDKDMKELESHDDLDKKLAKDLFASSDADGNSKLDGDEMKKVMERFNIPAEHFDWKSFDHNKDDHLSEDEFVAAGPAANEAAQKQSAASLDNMPPSLLEKGDVMKRGPPAGAFQKYDVDGSGVLEAMEAEKAAEDAGFASSSWLDTNGDGVLSRREWEQIAEQSRRADAQEVSFLQEKEDTEEGEDEVSLEDLKNAVHAHFDAADTNHDGFLEKPELKVFFERIGVPDFDWTMGDKDGDGKLSESEVVDLAAAHASAAREILSEEDQEEDADSLLETDEEDEEEGDGEDEKEEDAQGSGHNRGASELQGEVSEEDQAENAVRHEMNLMDTDKSGFLEKEEIAKLFQKHGVTDDMLDWHKFDANKDGKLSENELATLATEADNDSELKQETEKRAESEGRGRPDDDDAAESESPSSLVEEDEEDEDEDASRDGDGFYDDQEESSSLIQEDEEGEEDDEHEGDEEGEENEEGEESSSLLEEGQEDDDIFESVEQMRAEVNQRFQAADKDQSGFMEGPEAMSFLQELGVTDLDWHVGDTDKDGKLSQAEALSMIERESDDDEGDEEGSSEKSSMLQSPDGGASAEEQSHGASGGDAEELDVGEEFRMADKDRSGYLEEKEVEALMKKHDVDSSQVNWKKFDADKDNKLSAEELAAFAAEANGDGEVSRDKDDGASFLEEDEDENEYDDEEDDEAEESMRLGEDDEAEESNGVGVAQ